MAVELAGVTAVAAALGISRQRVDQLAADRRSGFPEPREVIVEGLASRRLWDLAEVKRWAVKTGRTWHEAE